MSEMIRPAAKGALAGGLVLFVWGIVYWMALPWHEGVFGQFQDEDAVASVLTQNAPQPGIYVYPGGQDEEAMEKRAAGSLRLRRIPSCGNGVDGPAPVDSTGHPGPGSIPHFPASGQDRRYQLLGTGRFRGPPALDGGRSVPSPQLELVAFLHGIHPHGIRRLARRWISGGSGSGPSYQIGLPWR